MDVLDEEMTMDNFNLHFYGEEVMQKKEEELRVGQVRPRLGGGINRKMLPYCESTEALYGEKRQVVYFGFCTNMILSEISPAETATRT